MKDVNLEAFEQDYTRRYRMKKRVNIAVCSLIFILGVLSVFFIFKFDKEGILTFRWLTVDGTIFTTVGALIYIVVNLIEMYGKTEVTSLSAYYVRLSCAVAEALIMVVVLMSQLPFFEEHMHIFRFDMFNMHILIPILTISSFVLNDAPIGKIKPLKRLRGTWFVTFYAVIIITLIQTGTISGDMIPYFFLDFANMPVWLILVTFVVIYGSAYLLAFGISELNRRMSWRWFKNIMRK
ncbi:hypothetical protein D6855_13470 [Butyrivibrio sp. CB08]|uniref:hypothetical protein n=1 Tax=Butyrivibrio sp. CB08 TaxID=2364879 RepID=UPI000EA9A5CE|nr:hypothetical protein [Butyrivibrio sp. CB08]RKM57552.1 hypothetical protein D6855_13470 [Butyrivibrio sp. CB08]